MRCDFVNCLKEPMSYENIDLSGFWRGSEKQIPESRKRLLRRGVELDYINTLTKPERRALFSAGHAFVNAEREANGQAPYYPRSSASFCPLRDRSRADYSLHRSIQIICKTTRQKRGYVWEKS